MNIIAIQLQLKSSHWANPHGLPHQMNKSTSFDMARLCTYALKN